MAKLGRSSKEKIFDGSVPGISYNKFRSGLSHQLGSGNAKPAGYHHNLYMHHIPAEYMPNINAPSVDWDNYETYEAFNTHHSSQTDKEMQFHVKKTNPDDFNLVIPQDDLTMIERFLQAMGKRNSEKCILNIVNEMRDKKFVNSNVTPDLGSLASAIAQLSKVFSQNHPDIINLRKAFSEMVNDPETVFLATDRKPSNLGVGNPYEKDTCEQIAEEYNRQIELFGQQSEQLSEPIIEQMSNVPISESFPDEQTLDDIVSDQDVSLISEPQIVENEMISMPEFAMEMAQPDEMAIEEINNAIDNAMEQPLFQQPKPIQEEEDPFLVAQEMFNQQMQFMNNQFMMPGP